LNWLWVAKRRKSPTNLKKFQPQKSPSKCGKKAKTIEEIAAIRLFTTSTIEGHFEKLIAEEKVDIGDVMEKATFDKNHGCL